MEISSPAPSVVLAALCAMTASSVAQQAGSASHAVAVPIAGRMEVFELDRTDGTLAGAVRIDARPSMVRNGRLARLDGARAASLGDGWSLTDRVLFRSADLASARAAVASARGKITGTIGVRAVDGLPGWFVAEAGRVDSAATLA